MKNAGEMPAFFVFADVSVNRRVDGSAVHAFNHRMR